MMAADEPCTPQAVNAMGHDGAKALADALKSLSDPLRIRILSAIAADPRGECCVCDLTDLAPVSQPTLSHHLKVMKEAGMLQSERRGTWVYYRIAPERRAATVALLGAFAPTLTAAPDMRAASAAPGEDDAVTSVVDRLTAAHANVHPDLVATIVRESFASLLPGRRTDSELLERAEAFAIQRLTDLTRDRTDGVAHVLFVCVQNAGRSQLAAALMTQLSRGAVVARSAGSAPAPDVHASVRDTLDDVHAGAVPTFPKPLTDDAVRASDVVVTMGCGDVAPIIAGVRYEDWAVGDPALASADGVAAIRADIETRVRELLRTLTADRKN